MGNNKGLSKFEYNSENPFAKQSLVRIGDALASRKVMAANKDEAAILKAIDGQTGEILGNTAFIRNKTVDEEQFAKFFMAGFKAFFDLKPATIKVFGFILSQLKPNSDEFVFVIDECMQQTQYGRASIFRALGELCNAEIIARGRTESLYYINPMIVFNGDRVTFATTYIKKHFANQEDTTASTLKGAITSLQSQGQLPQTEDHAQGDIAQNLGGFGGQSPLIPDDASPSPLPDVSDCPSA